MALTATPVDVKSVVTGSSAFGPREVASLMDAIAIDPIQFRVLRDSVHELEQQPEPPPAMKVRLGVGSYLLGRYSKAIEYLAKADGGALAHFYLAKSQLASRQYEAAAKSFEQAGKAGYSIGDTTVGRADALRGLGKPEEALKILDGLTGPNAQTAEFYYQRAATFSTLNHDTEEVVALYEKAIELDPHHGGALFGLAIENDRQGNDDVACDLYERGATRFPPHLGTLLNLGVIYEDREQFQKASQCYQRILAVDPGNFRAKLFFKDAEASLDMVVDEQAERRNDRMAQVLLTPVTDFELSVRARNCLQKMGIKTLGDLTNITENELLASKNFGETSLNEIKDMMASRGLRLGQNVEQKPAPGGSFEAQSMSPDEQALIGKPVNELNLSVRARKCMIRLGVNTIGELIRYTGDDLLECKNFGVTSLNEVREKLTSMNLKLRGE